MTWTPRAARAVVGTATLCVLGSAGLLVGTGAAVAAEVPARASAGTVSPQPQSFSFDGMSPGQTRSTLVDLASTHATDGSVVEVGVTTSGDLAAAITTSVEACSTPWEDGACPVGAVVLVEGWRGGQSGTSHEDVVLPAGATTSLKVSVTLDEDVPAGATGSIRYDLALRGDPGATPDAGAEPTGPEGPGSTAGTGSAGTGGGPGDGPLATTGASVWATAAASGALLGIGAALVRRRRHLEKPPQAGTVPR